MDRRSFGWMPLVALAVCAGCSPEGRDDFRCTSDSQCDDMEICEDETCVAVACKRDGDCTAGQRCIDHDCVSAGPCRSDADCSEPTPRCDPETGACVACLPECTGHCCGSDGCGGTCPDTCAQTGQVCDQESCLCQGECVPDCGGRVCGPDGCGATCPPGCTGDQVCVEGACRDAGCSSDADCDAPTPRCDTTSGNCVQCLEDGDCPDGRICSGGICADRPACEDDGQCELGEICADGTCVAGCRSTRDCPDGETCLPDLGPHGTCVECEEPGDCPAGTTCEEHQCVPYCTQDAHCTPQVCDLDTHTCVACNQDAHCPEGHICELHACVEGCREDADCESGICDLQTNRCVECTSRDDCPLGNLCIQQQCVTGCETSRDCPGDLQCDPAMGEHGACVECILDTDCADGFVCRQGLCVFFCSSDADCMPPEPACDTATGTCVACTTSDHCDPGTICIDSSCQPGCQTDRDCPDGLVCDPGLGDHGGCVECTSDGDCPPGTVCRSSRCVLEGSDMVRIPAGTFVMGSDAGEGEDDERPERVVSLPTYYIDRTEVTNDQYRACVQAGACSEPADTAAYDDPALGNHPVAFVDWDQAGAFCAWMGKALPSEARWERAARGPEPDERTYPWGETQPDCARANYAGCHGATVPVDGMAQGASAAGLLHMAGNVYEWVYDRYGETYYAASANTDDPWGPLEGDYRVARGGAFDSQASYIRCANRAAHAPDATAANLGFRCALRGVPVASFTADPEQGPYQTTTFSVDASASSDPNHPVDLLEVRWDWEDDGTFDTSWSTAKSASHRFAYNGIFRIRCEVRDPDENVDDTSAEVVAEGEAGWDGAACETDQDCAHGFACILDSALFEHICREECSLLFDTACHIEGQTCNWWIDFFNGAVGTACQPGS